MGISPMGCIALSEVAPAPLISDSASNVVFLSALLDYTYRNPRSTKLSTQGLFLACESLKIDNLAQEWENKGKFVEGVKTMRLTVEETMIWIDSYFEHWLAFLLMGVGTLIAAGCAGYEFIMYTNSHGTITLCLFVCCSFLTIVFFIPTVRKIQMVWDGLEETPD